MGPEGFGSRSSIPFRATLGAGGIRRWEVISEPFYARGEDTTALKDVNLFSLCNIKIIAERPEQNPARLKVDFTHFSVPPWIKISSEEVASALFICISYTSLSNPPTKPIISVVTSPEHKAMVERAKKTEYDKDDVGDQRTDHNKGDVGHRGETSGELTNRPVDRSKELTTELASPWSSVIVSKLIDEGCVAPCYVGVRVRSMNGNLTITTWGEENGKQVEGVEQPVTSFAREEFCAAVLKHYQAAVAPVDFDKHLAALPTQEARKKEQETAMALLIKAGGFPIGEFGGDGIDIRIFRGELVGRFRDNYDSAGWVDFQKWIHKITPKTK